MPVFAGEIDGKGIICNVYGDTVGYFFESDRAFEYKISGGDKGLEVVKKDVGKYYTNENSIFINEIKINRKDLKYQKFSSFRGECKAYDNFNSFIYLTLSAKRILSIYNSMLGEVNACFNSKSNSSECFDR